MLVFTHPSGLAHLTGPGHPERPARLEQVMTAIAAWGGATLKEAPAASNAQIGLIHPDAFQARLAGAIPLEGLSYLDADTVVSPGSLQAAAHAVGACIAAVDAIAGGEAKTVFCATRPPGHHAMPSRAMGFCLYNQIAVAGAYALQQGIATRIAIVDFDVHHGNGTQAAFWDDPRVFYASTHQAQLFPYSGAATERGAHDNILNLPLPAGCDGRHFQDLVRDRLLPAVDGFAPDLLLISAGFDAHVADPLAGLMLDEADFGWITKELRVLAERHGLGRIVSTLEGGYDIDALGRSLLAHLEALA